MISTLETGYFIWNISAWLVMFFFSAGIFCLATYIIKKRTGGDLVSNKMIRGCREEFEESFFEQKASFFKSRIMEPWFDFPFSHILSIIVLFLLFIVALFSNSGVE